jgi:tetratricopeptide (TPR) repeat protein
MAGALLAAILAGLTLAGSARAETAGDYVKQGVESFKLGDLRAMRDAKVLYEKALKADPTSYDAAWHLAETSYYLWESAAGWSTAYGKKQELLLDLSMRGVQAGRLAVKLKPDGVEGLFWLAANMGIWGLTNGPLDSLGQVPQLLSVLQKCAEVDALGKFERGSCWRITGALYTQLPGFPVSIGDKKKADEAFQKAMLNGSQYGINHTLYAELHIARGDTKRARETLEKALEMMRARKPYDYYDKRDIKRAEDLLKAIEGK